MVFLGTLVAFPPGNTEEGGPLNQATAESFRGRWVDPLARLGILVWKTNLSPPQSFAALSCV